MSALNAQEKVKIRHHLGYLNVLESQTFVLGTPAAVETQFIIEGAMNKVLPEAVSEVRRHLQFLDTIEERMMDLDLIQVTEIGELKINSTGKDRHDNALLRKYKWWGQSLANLLGVYPNPFDKRSSGGLNARVVG